MILTLTPHDKSLLLRRLTLPSAIHQEIANAPKVDRVLHLNLTDDDYLTLTKHLTIRAEAGTSAWIILSVFF